MLSNKITGILLSISILAGSSIVKAAATINPVGSGCGGAADCVTAIKTHLPEGVYRYSDASQKVTLWVGKEQVILTHTSKLNKLLRERYGVKDAVMMELNGSFSFNIEVPASCPPPPALNCTIAHQAEITGVYSGANGSQPASIELTDGASSYNLTFVRDIK